MRIENGTSDPSVYVLHHLSSKLNIDLNEYYKALYSHVSPESIHYINLLASLEHNYLSTAYKNYYSMPFIRRLYQETLYKLAVFYFDHDADSSLSYVERALSFSHSHDLSHLLPELLELKCKLLYRKNQTSEAYELYIAAERLRREFDGYVGV